MKNLLSNLLSKEGGTVADVSEDGAEICKICVNGGRLSRVGARKISIEKSALTNCLFEDVYFREAKLSDVLFTGSKFRNCNLSKAKFSRCDLRYCSFEHTQMDADSVIESLPAEANLRFDLATNLRKNFESIGDKDAADIFLNIAIEAHEKEQINIIKRKTDYHRKKYDNFDQIASFFRLISSKMSGIVWGYGHRVSRLVLSYLVMVLLFTCTTYFGDILFNYAPHHPPKTLVFTEALYYCSSLLVGLSADSFSPIGALGKLLQVSQGLLGYVFLALLAAAIYRRISR